MHVQYLDKEWERERNDHLLFIPYLLLDYIVVPSFLKKECVCLKISFLSAYLQQIAGITSQIAVIVVTFSKLLCMDPKFVCPMTRTFLE